MKKLFTLTALLLSLAATVSAQTRKTWDFSKGFSAITVSNLKADEANWTNKCSATNPVYFEQRVKRKGGLVTATVDGNAIELEETKGLKFGCTGAKHLNVFSNKEGEGCMWINGKTKDDNFTVPNVPAGEKVTIVFESHKSTEARGFTCNDEGVADASGKTKFTTKGRDTVVVINGGDTRDLTFQSTSGFHIYKIEIGNGDDPEAFKNKIGYLYTGDLTADPVYTTLTALDNNKVTGIDAATTTLTQEEARKYDVVVLGSSIPADNANVQAYKTIMPFEPTLNLNANLYDAWGYGKAVPTSTFAGVTALTSDPLLTNVDTISAADAGLPEGQRDIPFTNGNQNVIGVSLGSYFAGDDTVAVAMGQPEAVLIHKHIPTHNGYVYLPYSNETLADGYNTSALFTNAIALLKASKSDITAASKPAINVHYGQQKATIQLSVPQDYSEIYYTTNGTEPTEASTRYTEPFTLTQACTLKAVARAQGYLMSAVADSAIAMYDQVATPSVTLACNDDATTVTLDCSTPNVTIYYNFNGSDATKGSNKYTEPFVLNDRTTVFAFAVSNDSSMVQSEMTSKLVLIKNDRVFMDQVQHFDANKAQYQADGKSSTYYFFSWRKSAANPKDETKQTGTITDPDGVEVPVYADRDYETWPNDSTADKDNYAWTLKSRGQVMIWQSMGIGSDVGNSGGYNPATPDDVDDSIPATKDDIQFGKAFSGTDFNASVESNAKVAGPFDVVIYLGTSSGSDHRFAIETSADGNTWQQVGDTIDLNVDKRLFKKFTRGYRGNDDVYVRVKQTGGSAGAQLYDIYVLNEGVKSLQKEKELADEFATGVTITQHNKTVTANAVFSLSGARRNHMQRGVNIVRMTDGTVKKVLVK